MRRHILCSLSSPQGPCPRTPALVIPALGAAGFALGVQLLTGHIYQPGAARAPDWSTGHAPLLGLPAGKPSPTAPAASGLHAV